ncbi:hypothetical protein DL771_003903 [Monosporascus sp. 5C6A]|nr:hypothetical protein DL771_003903 [Monosporascus sp. 5C6A]
MQESQRLGDVRTWLHATNCAKEQERYSDIRREYTGTGRWLLDNQSVKKWMDPIYPTVPPLLWLNGIPGAVLCTEEVVEKLLEVAILNCSTVYIVIDGINECPRGERKKISQWFRHLVEDLEPPRQDRVRCLFVSQYDGVAQRDFGGLTAVRIKAHHTRADIQQFSTASAAKIQDELGLSDDLRVKVASKIEGAADGMFHLAELIADVLRDSTSVEDIEDELQNDALPTELKQAYARIMLRLFNRETPNKRDSRRAASLFILKWLVCAKRTLKWREIQAVKAVDIDSQTVDIERRRFRQDCRDLCGSMVETFDDGSVELVHPTAKCFLIEENYVQLPQEDLYLAKFCVDYLNLEGFRDGADRPRELFTNGYFALMDYAVPYWVRHLEIGLSKVKEDHELPKTLSKSLEVFLDLHFLPPTEQLYVSQSNVKKLQFFENQPFHERLQTSIISARKELTFLGEMKQGELALNLSTIVRDIRSQLESIYENTADESERIKMRQIYGADLYKCPRLSCRFFYNGFASKTQRDQHVDKHLRPFRCDVAGCPSAVMGMSSEKGLKKHKKIAHDIDLDSELDFLEEQELQEQERQQQQQQQKAQNHEPAQAAPRSSRVSPSPEEKRPRITEYPCSHCHKVFNKKYNRDSHLVTHKDEHDIPCGICEALFAREDDRNRHEINTHEAEKQFVCGGVLEDGRRWGCHKRFTRADTLRHHYETAAGQGCRPPWLQTSGPSTSTKSLPESSVFDRGGLSRATYPTTVATSEPRTKDRAGPDGLLARITPGMGTEAGQHIMSHGTSDGGAISGDGLSAGVDIGKDACMQDFDAETSYSLVSTLDDPEPYLQAFSNQLSKDLSDIFDNSTSSGIEPEYLETALKTFAWKLNGESSNPFQWGASVTLHQKRKEIVELLSRTAYAEGSVGVPGGATSVSEVDSDDQEPEREAFQKPIGTTFDWLSGIEPFSEHDHEGGDSDSNMDDAHLTAEDEPLLFRFEDYERFVRTSGAYRWLLSRIRQHDQLRWGNPDSMSEIGAEIRNRLMSQEPLRRISRRRPPSAVTMILTLDWNPVKFFHDQGLDPTLPGVLERVLSLTGTLHEAQATTVVEYMTQTWPETWEPIITLISDLVSKPEGEECIYQIPEPPAQQPSRTTRLVGFNPETLTDYTESRGSDVHPQFSGYPILGRPEPNTGLEMSLGTMAALIRSRQVVQWGERIIMKGFHSLVVATLATAGVIVWHLLVSRSPEERMSYIDPGLDTLSIRMPEGFSLRSLERSRHIIGWCANATDICGLNVRASGLPRPPASIVIDRLYIEGGTDFVAGLNMSINKKEQPFWLEREKDYPSLLKWASLQPIIFYDVSDRRGWLVDGASALLHLDGCTGRQASLKTLKNWDNLNLNLYIISKRLRDGQAVTEYCTLETRVKEILHSIEILIDRQVKVPYQDGIRIPQTLDLRRSIAGFDILDIITPLGPVHPRIQRIDSWGAGWSDLVPAVGIMTIFGSGFGDLIRPDDPSRVCSKWRSVPTGLDYMAASVSTLKMLYERRLARMEPGLGVGELTRKVIWLSPCAPLKSCECVGGSRAVGTCHLNPVQFLRSKRSWNPRSMSRVMTPVDVATLGEEGAAIFGHTPLWGLGGDGRDGGPGTEEGEQSEQSIGASISTSTQGSAAQGMLSPSAAGSTAGSTLTQPSMLTESTAGMSTVDGGEGREESIADSGSRASKRWKRMWKKRKIG